MVLNSNNNSEVNDSKEDDQLVTDNEQIIEKSTIIKSSGDKQETNGSSPCESLKNSEDTNLDEYNETEKESTGDIINNDVNDESNDDNTSLKEEQELKDFREFLLKDRVKIESFGNFRNTYEKPSDCKYNIFKSY
jgi:hypothetical protein